MYLDTSSLSDKFLEISFSQFMARIFIFKTKLSGFLRILLLETLDTEISSCKVLPSPRAEFCNEDGI